MKTIGVFFILFAMLLIAGCNPKVAVKNDLALADSLLKAADNVFNTKDAQQMANLYAEDALFIANGKNIWSRDSIYALFKSMAPLLKGDSAFKSYMGPTTVSTDVIQMQKYYTAELVMGNTNLKAKGVGFLTWGKQSDNSWKIIMFVEFADMKPY
jgi:uncharacterized protein (TIGR02246 family)